MAKSPHLASLSHRSELPRALKIGSTVFAVRASTEQLELAALDNPAVVDRDTRTITIHPELEHGIATLALFVAVMDICAGEPDRILTALRDNQSFAKWLGVA